MFVEYMAIKDKKEAEIFFDAVCNMEKPKSDDAKKEQLYITKENSGYVATLKVKKSRKRYTEEKWTIVPKEKGVVACHNKNKGYIVDLISVILSAIGCVVSTTIGFVVPDLRVFLLWLGLVFLFLFMFLTWKKLFKPSVALKIYLIRLL